MMATMSQKMDILREYEEALALALEKVHSLNKVAGSLHSRRIITQEDYDNFLSLDPDPNHLDPALKARYLLHVAQRNITKDHELFSSFVDVLKIYDEMRTLCHYILKEVTESEASRESVFTLSDDNIIVSETHIKLLVEILHDVRHKWEEIGVVLNLTEADLKECRDYDSNILRLRQILLKWKKIGNESVYLGTLKKTLENPLVCEWNVSQTLYEKFREKVFAIVPPQKRPRTGNFYSENTNELQVTDGKSIILEVVLSESNELGVCQWFKGSQPLQDDTKLFKVHTKFLLIKHACQGMDGTYICKIGNMKITKTLKVIFSPEKQRLLEFYVTFPDISNDSWPPVGTSAYIKLALINENRPFNKMHDDSVRGDMDDILEEKNIEMYEILFQKYENGTVFLIEGRPGSGKTTLTRKLSKDWATKPDILTGANLVFLVSLRMLNSVKKEILTLSHILTPFYSSIEELSQLVNRIEKNNGSECCFVVDGLDEYQERNDSDNLIHRLVNKKYLHNAMIIIASRPIGSVNLRRHVNISKRIEVLGFSKESIHNYIKSYFLNDEQKAEEVRQYLTSHINLLHMCYLPVHADMICYIYKQPSEVIPVTETKMYKYFTLLTIKRELEYDGNRIEYNALSELDGNILMSFTKVCKLAFDMTVQSKQTISLSGSDATLSENYSDVHSLGLVTIDKTAQLFGVKDLYSFLHLTFQEFLAAYHIHMCPIEEQRELIRANIEKKEMLNVWKFYCGTSTFDSESICLTELMKAKPFNDLYRIQCAFESQQKTVCDLVFGNNEVKCLKFNDHTFLPTDLNVLAYIFSQTSTPIMKLAFNSCILDEAGVQMLINSISSDKLEHIKSLIFFIKTDIKEQFRAVQILLSKCIFLEELSLENTEIDHEEVEILTDTVELPNLRYLGIHLPMRKEQIVTGDLDNNLSNISKKFQNLEEVRYTYNELRNETHKKCLTDLLHFFKCKIRPVCEIPIGILSNIEIKFAQLPEFLNVSNLVLVNCNLLDSDLEHLKNLVHENLEILRLDCNKITCGRPMLLHQFLEKCAKLTHISLSCNMIDNDGAIAIACSLTLSLKLLELDLQGNSFEDEGALALAKTADKMHHDFRLILGNCHISHAMYEGIKESTEKVEWKNKISASVSKFVDMSDSDSVERVMPNFKNLLRLNLRGKRLYFKKIANGIEHCIFLQTLDLSNCNLNNTSALFNTGHAFPNLRSLNLSGNKLGDYSVIFPKKICEGFVSLKELNLSHNKLQCYGVDYIAYCFRHIKIEVLNLSKNDIRDEGVAELARWLRIGKGLFKFEKDNISSKDIRYLPLNDYIHMSLNIYDEKYECIDKSYKHGGHEWHSSLLELDLSNNHINGNGAAVLGYGLKCCHKLQSLNLQNNEINYGVEVLLEELKHCPILNLNLDNNRFSLFTEQLWKLGKSIQQLSLNNIICDGKIKNDPQILLQGLKNYSNLKVLNLENIHIGLDEFKLFGEGLSFVTKLEQLRMGGNYKSCEIIVEGIKNNCNLKLLHLQKNILNSHCLQFLAKDMKFCQIVDLNLSQTDLHKVHGATLLSEGLKYCFKIQHLDLSSNELNSSDIRLLSDGIQNCKYLIILNLSNNDFDSVGAVHLAECMISFCNLRSINVSYNKIGSNGAVKLMDALKLCIEMEQLQIQSNCIGPDGAAAIADWIRSTFIKYPRHKSCVLTILNLNRNKIQSNGAIKIAEALQFCKKILLLSMTNNEIGTEAANPLAIGLRNCAELSYFYFDHNSFDEDSITILADGLKYCHSLQILSISNNRIKTTDTVVRAEKLIHMHMNCLSLGRNDIRSDCGLAKALPHCNVYSDQGLANQASKSEELLQDLIKSNI